MASTNPLPLQEAPEIRRRAPSKRCEWGSGDLTNRVNQDTLLCNKFLEIFANPSPCATACLRSDWAEGMIRQGLLEGLTVTAREKHHVIHQSNIRKPRRATPASILRLGLPPLALLTLTTITNRLGADPTFTDVTRVDSPDILFRNNQAGGFEDVTIAAGLSANLLTNGPTFADIDNDGVKTSMSPPSTQANSASTSTTAPAISPKKHLHGAPSSTGCLLLMGMALTC